MKEDQPLPLPDLRPATLITLPDAARRHNIPYSTLYAAVASGRIIHQRFNARILLDIASCDNYVKMYNLLKKGTSA